MALHAAPVRMNIADLTSGVGALVLGVGIGALFPQWFGASAIAITIAGLFVHALGMWDKHRLETGAAPQATWVAALYWVCWVMLAALAVWLMIS